MSKNDAITIMNNSSLNEKTGALLFLFTIYKKMSGTTYYYHKNKEGILNKAKRYYHDNIEELKEKAKKKKKIERII